VNENEAVLVCRYYNLLLIHSFITYYTKKWWKFESIGKVFEWACRTVDTNLELLVECGLYTYECNHLTSRH